MADPYERGEMGERGKSAWRNAMHEFAKLEMQEGMRGGMRVGLKDGMRAGRTGMIPHERGERGGRDD